MNTILIKTAYNSKEHPRKGETNREPSMVVPNQAMTVREILERYARGLPLSERQPVYHGEEYVPDIERMDLSDLQTLGEQTQATIKSYRDYQEAMKTDKQKAEAAEYRALKAEKEAREKLPKDPNHLPTNMGV